MNHLLKNAPLKVTDTYYVLTQSSNMTSRRTTKRSASCSPACSTAAATQALPTAATTYDALDLPLTRTISRNDATVTDTFGYNTRSELTSAQVNSAAYAYDYDNIGNRKTAQENAEEITSYQSNNLNQYTMLSVDDLTDFIPDYDADGNQTRVKTSTGIWAISYDAENRPTDFTKVDSSGSTTIHCEYDHMGRRATKQVTTNGNITLHQRYIYRGYLQIACVDLTRAAHPALWLITWDPTQPVATRPLGIQKDATWYTYGWDLTKNICEVYGQHGYIRTAYTYTPYGQVTAEGDMTQPIQWSSEYNDTEPGLVYYNYRHYNPADGRWIGRDAIFQLTELNTYAYIRNTPTNLYDILGNTSEFTIEEQENSIGGFGVGHEVYYRQKTYIRLEREPYYMQFIKYSQGRKYPAHGKLWIVSQQNKGIIYHLDIEQSTKIIHHNVRGGIDKVKGFSIANHSRTGAKFFGKTITGFLHMGRVLFVVGIPLSGIDIYYADDKLKETIRQVGGWAAASAGAWAGAKGGAWVGAVAGSSVAGAGAAPGAVVGGFIGGMIGGVTGWNVGTTIAETVYDWRFTPLEKEEFIICKEE